MLRILRSLPITVLLCLGQYALAQSESGTINGRVVDASGSAVPNAAVQLTNQATGVSKDATTEQSGNFVLTPVLPGVYTINVTAPGLSCSRKRA
ncbi:MAG: carboxypeptidase-like regulatory domain-containing protein [Bryobacteraceae bacterium]